MSLCHTKGFLHPLCCPTSSNLCLWGIPLPASLHTIITGPHRAPEHLPGPHELHSHWSFMAPFAFQVGDEDQILPIKLQNEMLASLNRHNSNNNIHSKGVCLHGVKACRGHVVFLMGPGLHLQEQSPIFPSNAVFSHSI